MPTHVKGVASRSTEKPPTRPTILTALLTLALTVIHASRLEAGGPSRDPTQVAALDADPTPPARPITQKVIAEYEALFGDEERRVAATPSTKDDAKFATELIQKASSLTDEPDLLRLVYEKAYTFGIRDPEGYTAAAEAAKHLATKEAAPGGATRLMDVYRRQFRVGSGNARAGAGDALITELLADASQLTAGHRFADAQKAYREAASVASAIRSSRADEIANLIKVAEAFQPIIDRIARLQSRLDQNPQAPNVREQILRAYLLELDDATDAMKFADNSGDPTTRKMLLLAAKAPKELSEGECLGLGAWFCAMASNADASDAQTKLLALGRAGTCYRHYLDVHKAKDAGRLTAEKGMNDVHAMEAKLEYATKLFFADSVVIYNAHNSIHNDRGATAVEVSLIRKGARVWTSGKLPIPWAANADPAITVPLPDLAFDAVRVGVLEWHGNGGALAEVQILRGSENLAHGGTVTASGMFHQNSPPTNLIDGVTDSATPFEKPPIGYWLLPSDSAGWAEIAPSPGAKRPSIDAPNGE